MSTGDSRRSGDGGQESSWFDQVFGPDRGDQPAQPDQQPEPLAENASRQPDQAWAQGATSQSYPGWVSYPASSPTATEFSGPPTQELPAWNESWSVWSNPPTVAPGPPPAASGWPVPYPPYAPGPSSVPPGAPGGSARPGRSGRSGGPRTGRVIATAALVALLVGGGAGYGGYRLAQARSGVAAPTAAGAPTSSGPTAGDTAAVARAVLPSTVTIQVTSTTGGTGGGTGSGFVFDRQGHILTNNHVASAAGDNGRLQIELSDGRTVIGQLVGRSASYDLAVIRVDDASSLTPVRFGDSDQVEVGQPALAIGSPLGLGGTVTEGIISATHRAVAVNESSDADAPSAYIDALQTDAAINPGNSGGPLVDDSGRVVGVNSAILTLSSDQQQGGNIGLGFAIPIDQAREVAGELIRNGVATYPVLGASVADGQTDSGVVLQNVEPGQPAARAGLQAGDLVTAIDGRRVVLAQELIVAIRAHRPGDDVVVTYDRGGVTGKATVSLGSREG